MEAIAAVLFEPVGSLAEFRPEEFNDAAAGLFAQTESIATGSAAYWRLNRMLDDRHGTLDAAALARLMQFESAAVDRAELYEDVRAAFEELRGLGVSAFIVSSLSRLAVERFIERFALSGAFAGSVARDEAGGVMAAPLRHFLASTRFDPRRVMYLVDTAEALGMTRQQGVNAVLLINDYDEGRALAEHGPAGAIVSLSELPDALRVIDQRATLRKAPRPPLQALKPFQLFDPGA